jgi:hypothetical protein
MITLIKFHVFSFSDPLVIGDKLKDTDNCHTATISLLYILQDLPKLHTFQISLTTNHFRNIINVKTLFFPLNL